MADVYCTLQPRSQSLAHRWRTGILSAVTGDEQRSSLFTWPRIILRGEYAPAGSREINWLKRTLMYYTDAVWGIPVWPDLTLLTTQAASGQKTIVMSDTTKRHYYVGRDCVIIDADDFDNYEIGTIDVLAAGQITLVYNLAATWPAGSLVLPMYDCRIAAAEETSTIAPRRQSWELEATEAFEEARVFSYVLPVTGAETYLGRELFPATIETPVRNAYSRPYDLLQFLGMGYAAGRFGVGDNKTGLKTRLTRPTRAALWAALEFFDARQGRLGAFWMPTSQRDIVADQAIAAADTVIHIEDIEYADYYLPNDVIGRHIFIQFPDRTHACRQIMDASGSTITLDAALGRAVTIDELRRLQISFLLFCRFDIDELTIEYPYGRGDFGRCELSIAGLINEAVA